MHFRAFYEICIFQNRHNCALIHRWPWSVKSGKTSRIHGIMFFRDMHEGRGRGLKHKKAKKKNADVSDLCLEQKRALATNGSWRPLRRTRDTQNQMLRSRHPFFRPRALSQHQSCSLVKMDSAQSHLNLRTNFSRNRSPMEASQIGCWDQSVWHGRLLILWINIGFTGRNWEWIASVKRCYFPCDIFEDVFSFVLKHLRPSWNWFFFRRESNTCYWCCKWRSPQFGIIDLSHSTPTQLQNNFFFAQLQLLTAFLLLKYLRAKTAAFCSVWLAGFIFSRRQAENILEKMSSKFFVLAVSPQREGSLTPNVTGKASWKVEDAVD